MHDQQHSESKKLSRDDILRELRSLDFPPDQYVVVGGSVLAVHNLRNTADIDLVCVPELIRACKDAGWEEDHISTSLKPVYRKGVFEMSEDLHYESYRPDTADLIRRADIIDGIPFASLQDTLEFKTAYGRPKDVADVVLIRKILP